MEGRRHPAATIGILQQRTTAASRSGQVAQAAEDVLGLDRVVNALQPPR